MSETKSLLRSYSKAKQDWRKRKKNKGEDTESYLEIGINHYKAELMPKQRKIKKKSMNLRHLNLKPVP